LYANHVAAFNEVKEKFPISDIATVGIYYFKSAQAFFNAAVDMISRNERVNGEFYVCPVYNYLIKAAGRVGIYEIDSSAMHGIGTPEDLNLYVKEQKAV
jgi:dTDP-glucose pyrophosphorylase